ncbi:MAG: signal peptidase II [Oscillospiraceae bacterium]|nr:signal peptidase II [Oscillospiraceae bacterium]
MLINLLIALTVFISDRLVKIYILQNFNLGETQTFIPGILQLTYFQNTGMAFSMLQTQQWVPMILTPLLLLILGVLLFRGTFPCKVQQWGLVALMAGGLGNWVDRLLYGFVIDMFEPVFIRFAIFNVADIFITVGGIVFMVAFVVNEWKKEQAKKKAAPEHE